MILIIKISAENRKKIMNSNHSRLIMNIYSIDNHRQLKTLAFKAKFYVFHFLAFPNQYNLSFYLIHALIL